MLRRPGDPPDLVGDAYALFFGLTSGARCYTATELSGWVTEAGFVDVAVRRLAFGRSTVLISGIAPGDP